MSAPGPGQQCLLPAAALPHRHVVCECGRQLRHRDSIAAGLGPVCRGERNRYPTCGRGRRPTPGTGQLDLLTTNKEATMGWAAGSDVFNRVARALIDQGADDDTKRIVLDPLIGALQDADWDTEDESLDEFRDDPLIVEMFAAHGIPLDPQD
ncbi:DUF6011 domain-containing protein [Nocardiopsis synnemataformans]|uniref:DUF6011 domain-containing protein n=1 Tax=Nocardiopsis synnemataformans TaxID=61305 RepID=UPI003EB9A3F6